jgi:hypothetical protein
LEIGFTLGWDRIDKCLWLSEGISSFLPVRPLLWAIPGDPEDREGSIQVGSTTKVQHLPYLPRLQHEEEFGLSNQPKLQDLE